MEITDLHRRLALLLDPEKCTTIDSVQRLVDGLLDKRLYVDGIYRGPAMILVGGSTGTDSEWLVGQLKQNLSLPMAYRDADGHRHSAPSHRHTRSCRG